MPLFSAFTPFGMLAFSGAPSEAEKIYDALGAQMDAAFDTTPGVEVSEDNEAEKYALAMHLARVDLTTKRAGDQRNVALAVDLLPLQELSYLAVPGAADTIWTRQQRLVAIRALSLGATQSNIGGVLAAALGSAFLKLRVFAPSEVTTDLPTSNFAPPALPPVVVKLVEPLPVIGARFVQYVGIDPTNPDVSLLAGCSVTVQGENGAQAEVVTVTATEVTTVTLGTLLAGSTLFEATFTKAHDANATVTTGPMVRWTSSKAFLMIEVTPAASVDPVIRAQVDTIMQKLARGVTGWAIVAPVGGMIGPFVVGLTPLGTSTLGEVTA